MKKILIPCLLLMFIALGAKAQHIKHYGVTVAGDKNGSYGYDSAHLYYPEGFFVDNGGNIYVSTNNNEVVLWKKGSKYGKLLIYDSIWVNNWGNIFVDDSGNIYYIFSNSSVILKCAPGAGKGKVVAGQPGYLGGTDSTFLSGPTSIYVDKTGNMYIADYGNNRVQKWAPGAKYGVTVAGVANGVPGSDSAHLNGPSSVFLDTAGNLYVADKLNNRIIKYGKGAKYGKMVAGDGTAGSGLTQLDHPSCVFVDLAGNIYTTEENNNRIQLWAKGAKVGRTVIASSYCSDSTCIYYPAGISVDAGGNIFVCDYGNSRVTEWTKDTTCDAYFLTKPDTGLLEHFIDSSYTPGARAGYFWSFGDSTYSKLKSPNHFYKNSKTYNVCLTVYDSVTTCSATFCQNVKPRQYLCQAYFTSLPDTQRILFYDSSYMHSSHISYSWDFGDSTSGNGGSPAHWYKHPGYYKVCESIFDSLTTCSSSYCSTVYVSCYSNFTALTDTTLTAHFYDSSFVGTSREYYIWNFGDTIINTVKSPVHTYKHAGTYKVCEYIIDSLKSCSSSYCSTITVGLKPCKVAFSMHTDTSLTASFTDASYTQSGKTLYKWYFGDGDSSTVKNPTHSYATAGIYNVCEYITDSVTGCTDNYCSYITEFPCSVLLLANTDTTLTVKFRDSLYTKGAKPLYKWTYGDGSSDSTANPSHTYSHAGTYNVCLYILKRDSARSILCYTCDSVRVGLHSKPCIAKFTIDSIDTVHEKIYITNHAIGADTTLWDFGSGDTSWSTHPTYTYANAGTYNLCQYILCGGTSYSVFCDSIKGANTLITRGGKGYTLIIRLANTSVQNIAQDAPAWKIYPNPVDQKLIVEMPSGINNGKYIIRNIIGQELKSGTFNNRKSSIDMLSLPAGTYLIQIQSTTGTFMTRLIKL